MPAKIHTALGLPFLLSVATPACLHVIVAIPKVLHFHIYKSLDEHREWCALAYFVSAVAVSSWDNNLYFYSVEYGRVVDTWAAHDDAVSRVILAGDKLVTSSWDTTLKVCPCRYASQE